jgi:hypothetical protein
MQSRRHESRLESRKKKRKIVDEPAKAKMQDFMFEWQAV